MPEPILTRRILNRATLSRQLLLERAALTTREAITRVAGLQAQATNSPYIGLWSRLRAFQRGDLTATLEQRYAVRATLMRATLHIATAEDYLFLRPALQPALTRALHAFFARQAGDLDIARLVAAARAYVDEAPRTFVELRAMLARLEPERPPELLAYAVRTHLPLVQVPPAGTWGNAGSPTHACAETWLGRSLAPTEESLRLLILRYMASFGPASVRDIQAWSGLTGLRERVNALRPELRAYRDERGTELFDLPNLPLPPADLPAPPRFLPEFDNLILSHADRTRVIADEYRPAVFLSAGRVRATFLRDGFVAGTWKIERTRHAATLVVEPFAPLAPADMDALTEEGERLLRFVEDGATAIGVRFADVT